MPNAGWALPGQWQSNLTCLVAAAALLVLAMAAATFNAASLESGTQGAAQGTAEPASPGSFVPVLLRNVSHGVNDRSGSAPGIFRDGCFPAYGPRKPQRPTNCTAESHPLHPGYVVTREITTPEIARSAAVDFRVDASCPASAPKTGQGAVLDDFLYARLTGPEIAVASVTNLYNGSYIYTARVGTPGLYTLQVVSLQVPFNWTRILEPVSYQKDLTNVGMYPVFVELDVKQMRGRFGRPKETRKTERGY